MSGSTIPWGPEAGEKHCISWVTDLSGRLSLKHHFSRHCVKSFQGGQHLCFPTQLYSKVLTQERAWAWAYTSQYLGFT